VISRFHVTLGEHIPAEQADSFTSQIAQYGLLWDDAPLRQIIVDVRRTSHLRGLRDQLTAWERWGYLRWSESQISN